MNLENHFKRMYEDIEEKQVQISRIQEGMNELNRYWEYLPDFLNEVFLVNFIEEPIDKRVNLVVITKDYHRCMHLFDKTLDSLRKSDHEWVANQLKRKIKFKVGTISMTVDFIPTRSEYWNNPNRRFGGNLWNAMIYDSNVHEDVIRYFEKKIRGRSGELIGTIFQIS